MLTGRRRDPTRNEVRFYAVALPADLLDGWAVVRELGRIDCAGRVRADGHGNPAPARAAAERLAARKRGRGYR